MSAKIQEKAKAWVNHNAILSTDKLEISELLANWPQSEKELTERFYRNLEFGTGGLRSIIGEGDNRINKYTVRKATYALYLAMKKYNQGSLKIAIAYDSRHFSLDFAKNVAEVMSANNVTCYLFDQLTPTPILSYAVRELNCQAGVMITASHNPPKYNGYKAFWSDGAQVVPPMDQEIIENYNNIKDWSDIPVLEYAKAVEKNLVIAVGKNIFEKFYKVVTEKVIIDQKMITAFGEKLKVVFTPLHGTGKLACEEMAHIAGFKNFNTLQSQANPDGNFSTVKYPNPEDPEALKLSVEEMLKTNSDMVLGTDPDCDRLGVVINNRGTPFYLNGNQIAALMLDYIFTRRKELKTLPANPLVIKSIVTSDIQEAICEPFGAKVVKTLTGFKWMALAMNQFEKANSNLNFVFASEESFGYMPQNMSRDKDGVSACILMSELVLYHKINGKNIVEVLDTIYERVGFFQESLLTKDYEGIVGAEKINRIMEKIRKKAPTTLGGEKLAKSTDLKTTLNSNVIELELESGTKVFLRPSGTEPKIKFYTMVRSNQGSLKDKKLNAKNLINQIEHELMQICEEA
jgi:phosphoglucomutase